LIQLCTGHAPLNQHLFRIGKTDSLLCPSCRAALESILYFIIQCPAYRYNCTTLARSFTPVLFMLKNLLGNTNTHEPLTAAVVAMMHQRPHSTQAPLCTKDHIFKHLISAHLRFN
ncbi:hypothetical protein C2E23DRAFT_739634, partial [Lenzites betulinus]